MDDETAQSRIEQKIKERKEAKQRAEQAANNKIKEYRKAHPVPVISQEIVVNGLKFIAEHRSMSQEELVDGLLALGCGFTQEEIAIFTNNERSLAEGIASGDMASALSIIVNVMTSIEARDFVENMLLMADRDFSIYALIRNMTGNPSYTKEYVDSLTGQMQQ